MTIGASIAGGLIRMEEVPEHKFILDVCCGGRMFWFDKSHPNVIYTDNREAEPGHVDQRNCQHSVKPDILMDFRKIEFPDNSFNLVVWDPPHLKSLSKTSIMAKKYGCLDSETWKDDLSKGFKECMRVLKPQGFLIFKWNECEISRKEVLSLFSVPPLFGHPIHSKIKTHWMCFMKYGLKEGTS